MPSDLQAFGAAALNARLPMPEGLEGPDGLPSERRFAVYRNNVLVGLVEALRAAYPVVHRLVGEAFFRHMGAYYVRRDPPGSPVMLLYGGRFPDFLAIYPPVAHLPWLPDVARLERARLEAWHAAEPEGTLAPPEAGRFGLMRARLHPSLRLVTSRFAARSIWQANLAAGEPGRIDAAQPEDTLILRPEAEVLSLPLPPGGAAFVAALQAGETVNAATLSALAVEAGFDLSGVLSLLFTHRAVIGLTEEETHAAA